MVQGCEGLRFRRKTKGGRGGFKGCWEFWEDSMWKGRGIYVGLLWFRAKRVQSSVGLGCRAVRVV